MRYAVRKRDGRWTVCAGHVVLLAFDDYTEAVETAVNAAAILRT
jgi:hypothetical protein